MRDHQDTQPQIARRTGSKTEWRRLSQESGAADPEQFVEVALNHVCPAAEITIESFSKFTRRRGLSFVLREVNDNPKGPVRWQLSCLSDDVFPGLSVGILLPKGNWIECAQFRSRGFRPYDHASVFSLRT